MKILLVTLITALLFCNCAHAQTGRPFRSVHFNFISKDSINLSLNEDFDLIEDSCSQATRYAHFNMKLHKFVGKIKDVSRLDSNIVMTEGTYNADGEKEGPFITRYVNGQLQAKGNFVKNNFDGKWEMYYDDGKPKLFFEANGSDIIITDYWDAAGKKLVDNGKGKYSAASNGLCWEGHLLDGKPEGSWSIFKTDDVSKTPLETEKYKGGVFQKGKSPIGEYTDAPRMKLVSTDMLPFVRAEALKVSARGCNDAKAKHIVYVQYKEGFDRYSDALTAIIFSVFRYVDLRHFSNGFSIEGEVNDQGFLTNLQSYDSFNQQVSNALIYGLKQAPKLEAASIDGRKVNEKVKFNFSFGAGTYSYNYKFGEVVDKSAGVTKK
ncbi:hypothetical protein [Mucilaginibacter panaciglaebae]|uniref:MORN repeat protein n=1 Tax=Mucilaginibacter panaciglaebae TaxID=502331 RepID=A0ABP7X097_9SPHI